MKCTYKYYQIFKYSKSLLFNIIMYYVSVSEDAKYEGFIFYFIFLCHKMSFKIS